MCFSASLQYKADSFIATPLAPNVLLREDRVSGDMFFFATSVLEYTYICSAMEKKGNFWWGQRSVSRLLCNVISKTFII